MTVAKDALEFWLKFFGYPIEPKVMSKPCFVNWLHKPKSPA